MAKKPINIITVVDIGSHKISCCVVEFPDKHQNLSPQDLLHQIKIIGFNELPSIGFKGHHITDMKQAQKSLHNLLNQTELQVNHPIDHIWISCSCETSKNIYLQQSIECHGVITQEDIEKLHLKAVTEIYKEHDYIMHAIPLEYQIDDKHNITSPVGMHGYKLSTNMMVTTAQLSDLRQIGNLLEQSYAELAGRVFLPYASGLGCLLPLEMKSGVLLLDIGAETTAISIFKNQKMIFADVMPFGGKQLTHKIARHFSTPLSSAEKIKCEKGTCLFFGIEHDRIEIPVFAENFQTPTLENIARTDLAEIIYQEMHNMLQKIHNRIYQTGILTPDLYITLTGGSANLQGIDQLVNEIFGIKPRIAFPMVLNGRPSNMSGTAYSALIGLVLHALIPPNDVPQKILFKHFYDYDGPLWKRIMKWMQHNL